MGIQQSAGSRNAVKRNSIISRVSLFARPAPRVPRAGMIKSPNTKSSFGFIFIRPKIISEPTNRHGVFTPVANGCSFSGAGCRQGIIDDAQAMLSLQADSSMASSVPGA
jgi:hypothetical protein